MTCFKISKVAGLALCADMVFALTNEAKEDSVAETTADYEVPRVLSWCDKEGICKNESGPAPLWPFKSTDDSCWKPFPDTPQYGKLYIKLGAALKGEVLKVVLPKESFFSDGFTIACDNAGSPGAPCDDINWANATKDLAHRPQDDIYNITVTSGPATWSGDRTLSFHTERKI